MRRLSSFTSKKRLRGIAAGLFYSKLNYCLPLYINTWGLDSYKVAGTRSSSFTKEDNRKLQVLQNRVARLLIVREVRNNYKEDKKYINMSTEELLTRSEDLSVQQMGALQTLLMTKKIMMSQKPKYLAEKLQRMKSRGTRSGTTLPEEKIRLGISREGFVERSTKLYNLLPENIKSEENLNKFKKAVKDWVKLKIAVKP